MHSDIGKTNSLNYSLFRFKDNNLIFRCVFRFRHLNLNKNKHPYSVVQDKLVWHFDHKGKFNVKSGYKALTNAKRVNSTSRGSGYLKW